MIKHLITLLTLQISCALSLVQLPLRTANCNSFPQIIQPFYLNSTILNSTEVGANTLNISTAGFNSVPFCRIFGQISYAGNNSIGFELWLPDGLNYNRRFLAVGNGGMAGVVDEAGMMNQLNKGFAVAGCDSGHLAADNNNGSGEPGVYLPYLHNRDQTLAWIHNSIADLTPVAKDLTTSYYNQKPSYSYYYGCSTGGAQGFALAQFHPGLFDGIYAGSPGNWYSHLALSFLWNGLKTEKSSAMNQTILSGITDAVLAECDANDGVTDGVIENPLTCDFNISSLACGAADTNASICLTVEQLAAVEAIYAGPKDTRTGKAIYPGFSFGSETAWLMQEGILADAFAIPILQNLVYDNLTYNASSFNFGSDVDDVDSKAGTLIAEISANLTASKNFGTKIIVTQGWADQYNAALWPIEHLEQLQNFFDGDVSDFFNLFMIPGGGHCGPESSYTHVPGTYHIIEKLVDWVERGEKPQYVLSTMPPDGSDTTRKLCAWPETATYVGGDESQWSSYVCEI